jgi:acetyltransferase-like isoleucine patch superfamily enzyme
VSGFDLLWWLGWGWCLAWAVLPFVLLQPFGVAAALLGGGFLAPWSALVGMAGLQRLLPAAPAGRFRMFADAGSIRWAVRTWAPTVYLALFQPLFFSCEGFQRLVLRAFGADLAPGALLTSRTAVREPGRLRVGADALIGEFVHLVFAFQPRPRLLVVGSIEVGARTLVGAHSVLSPGVRIGDDCLLEFHVAVGPGTSIGDRARIGTGSTILGAVRIGEGARVGRACLLRSGATIPAHAVIPDGAIVGGESDVTGAAP